MKAQLTRREAAPPDEALNAAKRQIETDAYPSPGTINRSLQTDVGGDVPSTHSRLADSLPIPILLVSAISPFPIQYVNAAAHRRLEMPAVGLTGSLVGTALNVLGTSAVNRICRLVCRTGQVHSLGQLLSGELAIRSPSALGWDIHLLGDPITNVRLLFFVATLPNSSSVRPERGLRAQSAQMAEQKALGSPLSRRELQVAELLAEGLGNREIAERLFVSRSTVATHVARILQKLKFRSRSQVAAWIGERFHSGSSADLASTGGYDAAGGRGQVPAHFVNEGRTLQGDSIKEGSSRMHLKRHC